MFKRTIFRYSQISNKISAWLPVLQSVRAEKELANVKPIGQPKDLRVDYKYIRGAGKQKTNVVNKVWINLPTLVSVHLEYYKRKSYWRKRVADIFVPSVFDNWFPLCPLNYINSLLFCGYFASFYFYSNKSVFL